MRDAPINHPKNPYYLEWEESQRMNRKKSSKRQQEISGPTYARFCDTVKLAVSDQKYIKSLQYFDPVEFEIQQNTSNDDNIIIVKNKKGIQIGYIDNRDSHGLSSFLNEQYRSYFVAYIKSLDKNNIEIFVTTNDVDINKYQAIYRLIQTKKTTVYVDVYGDINIYSFRKFDEFKVSMSQKSIYEQCLCIQTIHDDNVIAHIPHDESVSINAVMSYFDIKFTAFIDKFSGRHNIAFCITNDDALIKEYREKSKEERSKITIDEVITIHFERSPRISNSTFSAFDEIVFIYNEKQPYLLNVRYKDEYGVSSVDIGYVISRKDTEKVVKMLKKNNEVRFFFSPEKVYQRNQKAIYCTTNYHCAEEYKYLKQEMENSYKDYVYPDSRKFHDYAFYHGDIIPIKDLEDMFDALDDLASESRMYEEEYEDY